MIILRFLLYLKKNRKIDLAQKNGAIGCIIYDDPENSAPNKAVNKTYPNGEFLPVGGTQRGTIYGTFYALMIF